jgi:hypothetical protein
MKLGRFCVGVAALAALVLSSPAFAGQVSYVNTPLDTVQASVNAAIANVNTTLAPQGTGTVGSAITIPTVTSPVNLLSVSPGATGTGVTLSVGGPSADANAPLLVQGVGTGIVRLGQTICTSSGSTPQTCNGQRGIATTNSLSTAAATNAAYVINNSSVTTSSLVECTDQAYSGTLVTNGYPVIMSCVPGTGTITVNITNTHAANALSGTVQIGFAVLN